MSCTLPSLENFIGLFNRDMFLVLLELLPNTIEMRGNSFSTNKEICVKPPGATAAKEATRAKSVQSQLEAYLKRSILHYWVHVGKVSEQGLTKKWRDYNAIGGIAKNIDPSDLVDLGTDGSMFDVNDIFSLDYVNMVLHGKEPSSNKNEDYSDSDKTGSNDDTIKKSIINEGSLNCHPKIDLLQDDDGNSTCISLTQRSYATDDKHASLYAQLECRNNAEYILQSMKGLPFYRDQLIYYTKYDSKEAIFLPLERALSSQLTQAIQRNLGIDVTAGLYRHQALAIDALRNGQHLALATETSSGKSLVYNVPVVEAVMQDPGSTALYLFPTKALSQDQMRAIHVLTGVCKGSTDNAPMRLPVTSSICDGDSDYSVREYVQSKHGANIILTNPDMLHHTIMPQHKSYKRVFEKLRFVIIDESHQYKGTFGAHVSCVLKRLVRICRLYSLEPPQFICCSATISNPHSLFQDLVPLHVLGGINKLSVIDANLGGTAKGERLFGMWNPPLTEATQAALAEERERKKEEVKKKKKNITGGGGELESGSETEGVDQRKGKEGVADSNSSVVPLSQLAALVNSKSAARRMMAEAVLVEEEDDIGTYNDDDAGMRDFLRSCEDRYRHPVSWTGIYGNKPRHYKQKKSEKDEQNVYVNNDTTSSSHCKAEGSSPSSKNVIVLKRQRVTEQEKYMSERERESPFVEIARLFAYFVALRLRVLCFCGTRRLVEMINRMAQEELKSTYRASHLIDHVASYRGGYTAETRREIEAGLFGGSLLGVLATCALELGVDVGNLDVTLHLGFPGSYSSLWQQAGRAGRGGRPSLSIMVCFDSPVEQYFARNPEKLLSTPIEGVILGTNNPFILRGHLLCAANEASLNSEQLVMNGLIDEQLWGKSYVETALGLVEGGNLKVTSKLALRNLMVVSHEMCSYDHLSHVSFEDISRVRQYEMKFGFAAGTSSIKESLFTSPSRSVNLRLIDPISIDIVDTTRNVLEGGKVIDCMTYSRAFFEAFPGSVFYYQAKQYTITALDLASKRAYCHPTRVDYTTTALNDTIVTIIHEESQQNILNANGKDHDNGNPKGKGPSGDTVVSTGGLKQRTGHSCLSYGVVSVVKKVSGFIKRSIKTRELLDEGEFNLPPLEMQTQAVWIDLPLYIKREVERQGFDISGALHAANHAFCAVAAIESLCDVGDLDCEHFGTMSVYSGAQPRRMLMYDRRPGGLGICEALVVAKDRTLRAAHNILVSCDCSSAKGCPACLLDSRCSHYNENLSKEGAICLLKMLIDDMRERDSLTGVELTEHVECTSVAGECDMSCGCAIEDTAVISEEGVSSPLREDVTDRKEADDAETLTPRQLRRLRLKRQARFRDNHQARGLFITNGWSEAVNETTA